MCRSRPSARDTVRSGPEKQIGKTPVGSCAWRRVSRSDVNYSSRMKRRNADDENVQEGASHSYRKRVRSREPEVLGEADNLKSHTPTKGRRSRHSSNGLPSTRSKKLMQLDPREGPLNLGGSDEDEGLNIEAETPSRRGRRRIRNLEGNLAEPEKIVTPSKPFRANTLFSTPKTNGVAHATGNLLDLPNADRSARRKSARTIIERTIAENSSEEDEDEDLARHIYESEGEDDEEDALDNDNAGDEDGQDPKASYEIPSKKARGRPKGSKNRKRSATPPQDLPPHELYFFQNRSGVTKTSNNNLSSLRLLDHEEYFSLIRDYRDPHTEDMEFLQDVHSRSFNQWQFELSQNFNVCVYGWGSKRKLLTSFAEHVYKSLTDHESNKIVIVNGYVHNTSIRDILNTLAGAVLGHPPKLGSQVIEMLETLCEMLEVDKAKHITMIVHSIDGSPLRRATAQKLLARLASHSQIHLVVSADDPSFPLLWDSSLRSTYNFLFHDCTTFQPYTAEVDVVNEIHELLGRSGRRIGGKEGVTFVLKSLNQNSRKLFQLLIAEQLAAIDEEGAYGDRDEENGDVGGLDSDRRRGNVTSNKRNEQGVEYRLLYQKAVEDFICGDEVAFRTLLKEFHDHQMIHSRKDAMGTEMLSVPFRKEELETILEDLMA